MGMAVNLEDFKEEELISTDPGAWIAYAEESIKRVRFKYNGSFWAAKLIHRIATFVYSLYYDKDTRSSLGDFLYEPINLKDKDVFEKFPFCSDLEIQNPLYSIALFFMEEVHKDKEDLPQETVNVLVHAMCEAYRLIGEKTDAVEAADHLSNSFRAFARTCIASRHSEYLKNSIDFVTRAFLERNRSFFINAIKKLDPKLSDPTNPSTAAEVISILEDETDYSLRRIALQEASRVALERIAAEISEVLREESPAADGSSDGGKLDCIASAVDSITKALSVVTESESYYSQETKIAPPELISEHLDPQGGVIVPKTQFLQDVKRPKTAKVSSFLESLCSFNMLMTAYFTAVFKCAKTRNLNQLTLGAQTKWQLFSYYASHYAVEDDPEESRELHNKSVETFGEFGQSMKKLGLAFAEYEHELPRKPIILIGSAAAEPNKKKPEIKAKVAAEMIGISTRELRNWENNINRPVDYPGYDNEAKFLKWLAGAYPEYGKEFIDGQRKNRRTKGSPSTRISYDEGLADHQKPHESGSR